jgi:hypothetical protein
MKYKQLIRAALIKSYIFKKEPSRLDIFAGGKALLN